MQYQPHEVKVQEIAIGEAWLGSQRMEQEVVSPEGVVPGMDELKPGAKALPFL
ncbi:MAG: hypothetical protein J0M04_19100 [Verrucomicrobia bacterium]|nr:hypothetical protein [Verrucomicrobiota bacterium]